MVNDRADVRGARGDGWVGEKNDYPYIDMSVCLLYLLPASFPSHRRLALLRLYLVHSASLQRHFIDNLSALLSLSLTPLCVASRLIPRPRCCPGGGSAPFPS